MLIRILFIVLIFVLLLFLFNRFKWYDQPWFRDLLSVENRVRKLILVALGVIVGLFVVYLVIDSLFLKEYKTRQEMKQILTTLNLEGKSAGKDTNSLDEMVKKTPWRSEWMTDNWGNVYSYKVTDKGFIIRSAGKDEKFDTEDDLIEESVKH